MNRRGIAILLAEAGFWMPFWLLPWSVRYFTNQRREDSEVWISLFLSIALIWVAARFGKHAVKFRGAALVLLTLGCLFCTGLAVTHFGIPSPATMQVVLDTNPSETGEFVKHFLSAGDFLVLMMVFLPATVFLLQCRKRLFWFPGPRFAVWLVVLSLVQAMGHGAFAYIKAGGVAGLPRLLPVGWYPPVKPYIQFAQTVRLRREIAEAMTAPSSVSGVSQTTPAKGPRTFVVIIGESMAKSHMSLHGYRRPTTPRLDEMNARGELLVFQDAVSPHAQTGAALLEALTWKSPGQAKPSTILDFFNAAGFHTSWVSNQPGLGVFDNIAALLTHRAQYRMWMRHSKSARQSEEKGVEVFMNTKAWAFPVNERVRDHFDEGLLPTLHSVLRREERDKIIFVHLMGCHAVYRARFPKTAEFFTTPPPAEGRDGDLLQVMNDYDNAVRYSDSVVAQIIEEVREIGGESWVLYFSDHGEEAYDWRVFAAHSNERPSPLLYEIPFVLWLSDGFKASHPEVGVAARRNLEHPFSLAQLCATLAGLAQCAHPDLPPEHGLFAENHRPPPRTCTGLDFDAYRAAWRPEESFAHGVPLLPLNPDVARLDAFRHAEP